MRKLNVFNFITLNGYYEGPKHDISWHRHGGEENKFSDDALQSEGILLFGRRTYEMMYSFWPTPMAAEMFPETAKGMNKSEKIVFSKTLKKAEWNNSRIVRSSPVDEVMKLKKQPGKNISVDSISIFQELMSHNLIDEYWFLVHPLLSPKGKRLFEGLEFSNQLELTDTRKFKSGVVALHYRNIES